MQKNFKYPFKEKGIKSRIAAVILLLAICSNLAAEVIPGPDLSRGGFSRSVFDYHFSRADRELDPARWMAEARLGLSLAKNAWEQMALGLYEDSALFAEDSEKIDRWADNELESKFQEWLLNRFFAKDISKIIIDTPREIKNSNLNLIYYLDDDGNIMYDDINGDPLVIRPDNTTRDFQLDREYYINQIKNKSVEKTSALISEIECFYPELLMYIDEEKRISFGEKLREMSVFVSDSIEKEIETTKIREDRYFLAQRTGDIWSLRKKSDKEAASIISSEIIREVQDICDKEISDLKERIDAASTDSESIFIDGEEWLSKYREQFYRGLQAWQDAEERFFVRRIEWEQAAGKYWENGEEIWLAAFKKLSDEKEKWEVRSQELFNEGEELFKKLNLELENSIGLARNEFLASSELRVRSAGERAKANISNYINCGSLVKSAEEYIGFWIAELEEEGIAAPLINTDLFVDWMNEKEINKNSSVNEKKEIYKWYILYNKYLSMALTARDALINDFMMVMGEGALVDVLNENASSEDFFLDEYQIELLRAKAVSNYWAQRVEIAQAVNDYAVELSSGRTTNNESVEQWDAAKIKYDEALNNYNLSISRLNDAEENLVEAKNEIDMIYDELIEAELVLNRLNEEYSILKSIYSVKNADKVLLNEMSEKYKQILQYEEILRAESGSAVYADYLLKTEQYGYAVTLSSGYKILSELITGDAGNMSLNDLNMLYENIIVPDSYETIPEDIDDLGVSENSKNYSVLSQLLNERSALNEILALMDIEDENYNEILGWIDYYNETILTKIETEKEISRIELESRKAALRLLTAESTASWYFGEMGYEKNEDDLMEFNRVGLKERLQSDYNQVYSEYTWLLENSGDEQLPEEISIIYELELRRISGLISAVNTCKQASKAMVTETIGLTKSKLCELFLNYGIEIQNNKIFDIENISKSLIANDEVFIDNTTGLIYDITIIFNSSTNWISKEGWIWVTSFIEYIAKIAIQNNIRPDISSGNILETIDENNQLAVLNPNLIQEIADYNNYLIIEYLITKSIEENYNLNSENELNDIKNWREYLNDKFIETFYKGSVNYDDFKNNAFSFIEGDIKDSVESLTVQNNLLNEILGKNFDIDKLDDFSEYCGQIQRYIEDSTLAWNNAVYEIENILIEDLRLSEEKKNKVNETKLLLNTGFGETGRQYELAVSAQEIIKIQMDELSDEIQASRNVYQNIINIYSDAGDRFIALGNSYQEIYNNNKLMYSNLTKEKNEFEKQDAIKKWASTSYLTSSGDQNNLMAEYKNPVQELSYSSECLNRAEIVLSALEDLYKNGEEYREFDSVEYKQIYNDYKETFEKLLSVLMIKDGLENEIKKEVLNNNELYVNYQTLLETFGAYFVISKNDKSEHAMDIRNLLSIITVEENGYLAFRKNEKASEEDMDNFLEAFDSIYENTENTLLENSQINKLFEYFTRESRNELETHGSTDFELAIRDLSEMIAKSVTSFDSYRKWSMAGNYLIYKNSNLNSDVLNKNKYTIDSQLESGTLSRFPAAYSLGGFRMVGDINLNDSETVGIMEAAYNSLSVEEQKLLEFYTILTLAGGGGKESDAFKRGTMLYEYEYVYGQVSSSKRNAEFESAVLFNMASAYMVGAFFVPALAVHAGLLITLACLNVDAAGRLRVTLNQLSGPINEISRILINGTANLNTETNEMQNYLVQYEKSCDRLAKLRGEYKDGRKVNAEEIELSLITSGIFDNSIIEIFKNNWNSFITATNFGDFDSVPAALAKMIEWLGNERSSLLQNLQNQWSAEEVYRLENQNLYRELNDLYIEKNNGNDSIYNIMDLTYGSNAAAQKNHILLMGKTLMNNLNSVFGKGSEYKQTGDNLISDYLGIASRVQSVRLTAELEYRELEWLQQINSLRKKYDAWKESVNIILESGRMDWQKSRERMAEKYNAWRKSFKDEYQTIESEWDEAYLLGLNEKSEWLEAINKAAGTASENALLSIIGSNAEKQARAFDSYEPIGAFSSNALLDSELVLQDILNNAGISQMENMFKELNSIVSTENGQIRRGIGGVDVWDSGKIQLQAYEITKAVNSELEERMAKTIAVNVRKTTENIKNGLLDQIKNANENFREKMDETFTLEGQWRRAGNNYEKDVIIDSSVIETAKTERVFVPGYSYFNIYDTNISMDLETDISESRLNGLAAFAIEAIIQEAQDEIYNKSLLVFGKENGQKQEPGLFGDWIGEEPVVVAQPDPDDKMERMFDHQGSGELGRLLRSYIYWSLRESKGVTALNAALWDKPLWLTDGPFKVPSLRQIGEIVTAVAAGALLTAIPGGGVLAGLKIAALSAGMNLADDLVFNLADVGAGYKTLGEAGFEFGKKVLSTAASSAIGFGFSGLAGSGFSGLSGVLGGGVTNAAGKVMIDAAVTGVKTLATSTITSALSAVTYSSKDGFGFSGDTFTAGLKGGLTGALASMGGVAVKGLLDNSLTGFTTDLFKNGSNLSNLTSQIVSQSVNYAMGGDFTMNVLNSGMFSDNNLNTGLLELHFGSKDGFSMNVGTDGANFSIDNVISSLKGLETWAVNGRMALSGRDAADTYASQLRTLYSRGDVDRDEFENVLAGNTVYETDPDADYTKSITEGGKKTVYLGKDAFSHGGAFGLNVVFSHEAYRNGEDDELAQRLETDNAVIGHIGTAKDLIATYGTGAVGIGLLFESMKYDYANTTGNGAMLRGLLDGYDSSGDFWKLMENGSLAYDGDGWLKDPNGNLILDENGNEIGAQGVEGGLAKILGISSVAASQLLKDSKFTAVKGYWNVGTVNDGKSITLDNALYAGIYEEKLAKHNTLNIYNNLVANDMMDLSPTTASRGKSDSFKTTINKVTNFLGFGNLFTDSSDLNKYISYEEYKANNFIQGMPLYQARDTFASYDISTLLGATGNLSANPHRGVDGAVPAGTESELLFFNDTSRVAYASQGEGDRSTIQGLHVNIATDLSYVFKGQSTADTVYYRSLHLSSTAVTVNSQLGWETVLGSTGNTGQWGDSTYGNHSHEDIYTSKPSPYLDYLTKTITNSASRIEYNNSYYYDKFLFADRNNYKIRADAYLYNK